MKHVPHIPITPEMNRIAAQEGHEIYANLREKYPNNTDKDLDIILNSLCAAVIHLGKNTHDVKAFNQLVMNILERNTK